MTRRGGLGMNPAKLLRQVQKIQADVERVQTEAEKEVITVTAGGGAVEVTITGGMEIRSITLQPEVVDPEDVEMLQDLILAAVNEAIQKARDLMAERMSSITGGMGGMGIPGL
ncbi:MAG: YbaB/EbfC family nucleoid-associated protein [Chloroflexi bacterium]|nr:YbaB/EbfC family nucleoid-associated protein [Anaerolineae bacterium]RLC84359.1 MAG: YbaB/EbfC family nucleoid-associated protein [Chloroflexota bacterium]